MLSDTEVIIVIRNINLGTRQHASHLGPPPINLRLTSCKCNSNVT